MARPEVRGNPPALAAVRETDSPLPTTALNKLHRQAQCPEIGFRVQGLGFYILTSAKTLERFQSGDDDVLRRMERGYTAERYRPDEVRLTGRIRFQKDFSGFRFIGLSSGDFGNFLVEFGV